MLKIAGINAIVAVCNCTKCAKQGFLKKAVHFSVIQNHN